MKTTLMKILQLKNQPNTLEFHIPSSTIAFDEVSRDAAKYRPDRPPGP